MRFNNRRKVDYDYVADFLKAAVQQVKTQEDVDVLNEFKKVFKKNVPFTLRGYLSAYLLKVATNYASRPYVSHGAGDENGRSKPREDFRHREPHVREAAAGAEHREPHPRVEIPAESAATIFVGIGRNRRVFPRDLVGLLISVAGLERDRIGDIRVLANYSFVQLYAEDTDKAIAALNEYEYRGRKLSVSYSRQKDGEEGSAEDAPSESYSEEAAAGDQISEQEKEDAAAYAAAERASSNEGFGTPLV